MCEYGGTEYLVAGDEISSTYEGRHITLPESALTHVSRVGELVHKGDPVQIGSAVDGALVGVAFKTATGTGDLIAVDTEGIWALTVIAENYAGNSAIAIGDRIYIGGDPGNNPAIGVGILSKDDLGVPFGYALSTLIAGYTGLVAVKVHAGTAIAQP